MRRPVTTSPPSAVSSATRAPAADHRPADGVGVGRQDETEGGAQWTIQPEHRVGRDPGEQSASGVVVESAPRQAPCGTQRRQAESGHGQGMAWDVDDGLEQLRPELLGVAHERPEQPHPRLAVRTPEARRGRRHGSFQDGGPTPVEWMGDRRVGMDELHAVRGQIHGPEERRRQGERQDRRAGVVAEPGERQFVRAHPAARRIGPHGPA